MAMWCSTHRILTTHGGNLPRPADLDALIASWQDHQPLIEDRLPSAIREVVDKQLDCGVTILVRHSHEWRVWEDVKLPDGKTRR